METGSTATASATTQSLTTTDSGKPGPTGTEVLNGYLRPN